MNLELLIKYILNKLGQKNSGLSKTVLLKYVYLADYYYATENNGETFSKSDWKFIQFGPYSDNVINQISQMKANNAILAKEFFNAGVSCELFTYTSKDANEFTSLFQVFPEKPRNLLGHAINKLGTDQNKVLEFVYSETQAMLQTQPHQPLNFSNLTPYEKLQKAEIKPVSLKVKKQAQEILKKLTAITNSSISTLHLNPIHDESYYRAKYSDLEEPIELRGTLNMRNLSKA